MWRVPVAGGEAEQVTDDGGVTSLESYDGRTLYYVKTGSGPQPLFARTLADARRAEGRRGGPRPHFAVDEPASCFSCGATPGPISLRHLDRDTGKHPRGDALDVSPTVGFTVSRDGRTILFAAIKPANDGLYLIENFR